MNKSYYIIETHTSIIIAEGLHLLLNLPGLDCVGADAAELVDSRYINKQIEQYKAQYCYIYMSFINSTRHDNSEIQFKSHRSGQNLTTGKV